MEVGYDAAVNFKKKNSVKIKIDGKQHQFSADEYSNLDHTSATSASYSFQTFLVKRSFAEQLEKGKNILIRVDFFKKYAEAKFSQKPFEQLGHVFTLKGNLKRFLKEADKI